MCRSRWKIGRDILKEEEKIRTARADCKARQEKDVRMAAQLKRQQMRALELECLPSPWEAIRVHAPLADLKRILEDEQKRLRVQEHRNFDVDARNPLNGESLIESAVFYGNLAAVEYLIYLGANTERVDHPYSKCTLLHLAARRGDYGHKIVKTLVEAGVNMSLENSTGDTSSCCCPQ